MTERSREAEVGMDESGYFEALSKQTMDFHDALAELIDNAISASITDTDYINSDKDKVPEESFEIEVQIEEEIREDGHDLIHVSVLDDGKGMDMDTIVEDVLKTGFNHGDGILNEHGMGLKNSLTVLTKNRVRGDNAPFTIVSQTAGMDDFARYEGPFEETSEVTVDDYGDQFSPQYISTDSGTSVQFTTTFDKLNSVYQRASNLDALMKALQERLGLMYYKLLEFEKNKLHLLYREEGDAKWTRRQAYPISPVLDEDPGIDDYPEHLKTSLDDARGDVYYKRGVINWEETREKYEGKNFDVIESDSHDSPFRIYHRQNQETQGVNIVFNGRTLESGVLNELWDAAQNHGDGEHHRGTISRHNRYNDFWGEVVITDDRFDTVNNKIAIDPDNDRWKEVKEALNDNSDYFPISHGREVQHNKYKRRLKAIWEADDVTVDYREEEGVWDVDIDLWRKLESGNQYIYEIKSGKIKSIDVYQLVMYWDSFVESHNKSDESGEDDTKDQLKQAFDELDIDIDEEEFQEAIVESQKSDGEDDDSEADSSTPVDKGIIVGSEYNDNAEKVVKYLNGNLDGAATTRLGPEGEGYNIDLKTHNNLSISDETYTNPEEN